MTRDEFMKKARGTVDQAFEHRKNGIMNLVEQAWAEGKHNAEVETLRAAIEEALDRRQEAETIKKRFRIHILGRLSQARWSSF